MEHLNGIRLREFQQVRNEIRGSTEYLIVGLDIAIWYFYLDGIVIGRKYLTEKYAMLLVIILYAMIYHRACLSLEMGLVFLI